MYHAIIFTGLNYGEILHYRPIGAYRIRTELESKGYNVKVIEHFHHLTDDHIEQALDKYVSKETLWVGFSTTFINTSTLLLDRSKFFTKLKEKYNLPFVIGGAKALVDTISWADILITGYADDAAIAITDHFAGKGFVPKWTEYKGKKLINSNHSYDRKDLSNIGVIWKPEDHITTYETIPMEIARGCIFNCAFCNFPLNNKKKFDYIRVKEDMTAEFLRNYEQFGTTSYSFMDDTYNDSMLKLELMHDVISNLPFKIKFDTYIKPELLVRWPEQIDLLVESGLRGASLGLESLNNQSRQAVQKGADGEKVLDAISQLKSKSKGSVKIQTNLIVGLPHETPESLWKTHDIIVNNNDIDWWNWYALQIHSKDRHEYHSPIDRDPAKYGYELIEDPILIKNNMVDDNQWIVPWRNEHMDSNSARDMANLLRRLDKPLIKIAGWSCGAYATLGIDIDDHYEKKNGIINSLPMDDLKNKKIQIIDNYIQKEII
jgi:radical SAM superfamily enzyme YgiQ (UPF0313 family)